MPGIASATWASTMRYGTPRRAHFKWTGRNRSASRSGSVIVHTIDFAYFETLGVALSTAAISPAPIRRRRLRCDRESSIRRPLLAATEPIGHRFHFFGETAPLQVVGVAGNANYTNLGEAPQPCVFSPVPPGFFDGNDSLRALEGLSRDGTHRSARELLALTTGWT